jgi:hypothetical protein
MTNAYNVLDENTKGKTPHGRYRRSREDNIKMDLE